MSTSGAPALVNEGTLPAAVPAFTRPAGQRRWILNAFDMNATGHVSPGSWKREGDRCAEYNTIKYWTDLAQLLERGKLTGLFVADVLGAYDVYGGNADGAVQTGAQFGISDPTLFVSAAAAATKNLTFGITQSVTYENPFTVARRFATLDHLTQGRVGINIVTSTLTSAARYHGLEQQIEHDERYRRADEYTDVLYKLWLSSWREDAVVLNKARDVYAEPSRVRPIDHDGKYFKVAGPSLVEPSPQGSPVIYQAGGSPSGLSFAAKHAEAVFLAGGEIPKIRAAVNELRSRVAAQGRDPFSVKVILGVAVIIGTTNEEAQEKEKDLRRTASALGAEVLIGGWVGVDLSVYGDDEDLLLVDNRALKGLIASLIASYPEEKRWTVKSISEKTKIGGLRGRKGTIIGSPATSADALGELIEQGDVDGFNFSYVTTPGSFEDIVNLLVPELQRRGVHWLDYPSKPDGKGLTARESLYGVGQVRLRDDHYAHKFEWLAGQEPPALSSGTEE